MDLIASTEAEKRIVALIAPLAEAEGFSLVRVRLMGGARRKTLQIMAETIGAGGTDVEDLATLSRLISPVLDAEDPIRDSYTLEVSTPGIDRPLTRPGDFDAWAGHFVKLELNVPVEGQRRFTGIILDEVDGTIRLELQGAQELAFTWPEITKASLVLTDELIDAAREAGSLPPQPDEDGAMEDFEIEDDIDDDESETEEADDTARNEDQRS